MHAYLKCAYALHTLLYEHVEAHEHIVVHQSRHKMKLVLPSLPIYCKVANHSVATEYEWSDQDGPIGVCSPVLYVRKAGMYKCKVTDERENVCMSHNIEVILGLLLLIILHGSTSKFLHPHIYSTHNLSNHLGTKKFSYNYLIGELYGASQISKKEAE